VIPRDETIEYMRENYAQFQSALAMLDRMYEDLELDVAYRGRQNGHRHSFHNRSDALIELFEGHASGARVRPCGGYAVSASNARFSTDLDIVVAPDSKADFVEFIEHRGFEETDSHAKESLLVSLGVRIIIGFIVLAVASGCVLLPSESTSFTT